MSTGRQTVEEGGIEVEGRGEVGRRRGGWKEACRGWNEVVEGLNEEDGG